MTRTPFPVVDDPVGVLADTLETCAEFPATFCVDVPHLSPLDWLSSQTFRHKFIWRDRKTGDLAAGASLADSVEVPPGSSPETIIQRCRARLGPATGLRMYGGFSFDGNPGWEDFGAGHFWLPRFELRNGRFSVTIVSHDDARQARQEIEELRLDVCANGQNLPRVTARRNMPDLPAWTANVEQALELISTEVLEKIVLARMASITFESEPSPIALATRLIENTTSCYHFCFQVDNDHAFVGASPERLFARQSSKLLSEVVAGTRPRGETVGQDQRLAYELLTSDKDQLEHDIVRKSIRQRLHHLVDSLEVDSPAWLLKLASKQHLCSEVTAKLKENVTDGQLIERLHPTPAVGGYPTENALPEIASLEPFDRGWYAAPVGWISRDASEFVVGIRSGRVKGCRLDLYSGAGIVSGSTPEQEWAEIENKIVDFISIIGDHENDCLSPRLHGRPQ